MSEERLIKKLMSAVKYSVCGQCYEAANIDILGHEDDLWFLKAFCPGCTSESLMAAIIEEKFSSEPVTDLTPTELKVLNKNILTPDAVLDMHNFLKNFKGDFSQLFN